MPQTRCIPATQDTSFCSKNYGRDGEHMASAIRLFPSLSLLDPFNGRVGSAHTWSNQENPTGCYRKTDPTTKEEGGLIRRHSILWLRQNNQTKREFLFPPRRQYKVLSRWNVLPMAFPYYHGHLQRKIDTMILIAMGYKTTYRVQPNGTPATTW